MNIRLLLSFLATCFLLFTEDAISSCLESGRSSTCAYSYSIDTADYTSVIEISKSSLVSLIAHINTNQDSYTDDALRVPNNLERIMTHHSVEKIYLEHNNGAVNSSNRNCSVYSDIEESETGRIFVNPIGSLQPSTCGHDFISLRNIVRAITVASTFPDEEHNYALAKLLSGNRLLNHVGFTDGMTTDSELLILSDTAHSGLGQPLWQISGFQRHINFASLGGIDDYMSQALRKESWDIVYRATTEPSSSVYEENETVSITTIPYLIVGWEEHFFTIGDAIDISRQVYVDEGMKDVVSMFCRPDVDPDNPSKASCVLPILNKLVTAAQTPSTKSSGGLSNW